MEKICVPYFSKEEIDSLEFMQERYMLFVVDLKNRVVVDNGAEMVIYGWKNINASYNRQKRKGAFDEDHIAVMVTPEKETFKREGRKWIPYKFHWMTKKESNSHSSKYILFPVVKNRSIHQFRTLEQAKKYIENQGFIFLYENRPMDRLIYRDPKNENIEAYVTWDYETDGYSVTIGEID